MERSNFGAHVSPTERTVPNDPERTIASPRFDEKSVQHARPAVPLTLRGKARTWPIAVVLTCVLAGLLGGLLGGVALMKYQGSRSHTEPAASSTQPSAEQSEAPASDEQRTKADRQSTDNQQSANTQPAATNQQAANDRQAAINTTPDGAAQPSTNDEGVADSRGEEAGPGTRAELRSSLEEWVAATNARDIERQMSFYAPTVEAFYLARNASRAAVREEKSRVFSQARAVEVRASEPDVRLSDDGRTAVMRFRKRYRIDERGGEVLQELRWRRTGSGWRIVGERDLRVIQ
jgi:ketosteroid isomerase-like protein